MTTVYYLLGILVVVVGIGVSIALHELGHLVPAKRFGVKCTQFMIGFGPTIWARTKGETEVGIKAIPLGGYVRMIGMIAPRAGEDPTSLRTMSTSRMGTLVDQARKDSMDEIAPGDENRVFYKLSVPKKVVVMLGGPLMNLVLAFVVLTVLMTGIGVQQPVPTLSTVAECVPTSAPTAAKPFPDCVVGDPKAPAAMAGLQAGDTVVEVSGQPVQRWAEVTERIRAARGGTLDFVVERSGTLIPVTAQIAAVTRAAYTEQGLVQVTADGAVVTETVGYLGASASIGFIREPITEVPAAMGRMLSQTATVLLTVPEKMVGVYQAVTGQAERDPEGPISVVGVARVGGEIASGQLGPESPQSIAFKMLWLLFGLNIALFMFNLLPLLPLDGGQVVGALWEGLKRTGARLLGRPDPGYVDVAKGLPIAYAVSTLLIAMTILLVYADLVTPVKLS
ncbi:MAG: site-2 protease family protein [Candidatus Phosphoribacter sp.]|nr:site-2 protease family protein [Actinomycetales bacterium]